MRTLVTGAAGFIGSHLCERLLADGHQVVGVDAFTEYYSPELKERNVAALRTSAGFTLHNADVATVDLEPLLEGVDVIFHLAGQPGVRASWGEDFRLYLERNLFATQRLLEAVRGGMLRKLVFASSSSVYGDAECYPTHESDLPCPISPYGVTKLAGERLCLAYGASYDVPVVALRYFTVYGPRQRPDMAFSKFIRAIAEKREITVFGDGRQTRDYTYVSDIVDITVRAAVYPVRGEILNAGGGSRVELLEVFSLLGEFTGMEPRLHLGAYQRGDVRHTGADLTKSRELLGYAPQVTLREGLRRQVDSVLSAHPAVAAQ